MVTSGHPALSPPAANGVNMSRSTFYLTRGQILELEILMLRLRTQHQARVGKSDLMRLALKRLLALKTDEIMELLSR